MWGQTHNIKPVCEWVRTLCPSSHCVCHHTLCPSSHIVSILTLVDIQGVHKARTGLSRSCPIWDLKMLFCHLLLLLDSLKYQVPRNKYRICTEAAQWDLKLQKVIYYIPWVRGHVPWVPGCPLCVPGRLTCVRVIFHVAQVIFHQSKAGMCDS